MHLDFDEVVAAFQEAGAALAPIYDVEQLVNDPQIKALETIKVVEDDDLGPLRMQNVMFRMQETPGSIRWTGRGHGQDSEEVYRERLGLDEQRLAELREQGVI